MRVEVLISDDNDSYSVADAELRLGHQLCIAHVRKYVSRRTKSILEQARMEGDEQDEKHQKLSEDLKGLKGLLEELFGKEAGESGGGIEDTCSLLLHLQGRARRRRKPQRPTG